MKRVTGLGGVFFKCEDPEAMRNWYKKHLGIPNMTQYGGVFEWEKQTDNQEGHTVWSPFKKDSTYFGDPGAQFMINYRVENLVELLKVLESEGVEIVGEIESFDYGKFGWIKDPEGNKIELWEPVDSVFKKMNEL